MDNLSTNQKVALGVSAAAATIGAIAAFLWLSKKEKDEELDEDQAESVPKIQEDSKPKKEPQISAKLDRAAELRAEGNKAFTNKNYDDAIRLYTEALELSAESAHLLYSNRSAAFLFKGEHDKAVADAQKCLDLKPDWSKAYFRMGKALMSASKFDEAFKQFYKGTLVDKSSDELRVLLEQCSRLIGICDKDPRTFIEKEISKLYSREQCENLCNVLNTPYETIRNIVEMSVKDESSLLEDETIEKCVAEHPVETYRILGEILIELEKPEEAHIYAGKAYEAKPNDPDVLLLLVTTTLRSSSPTETYSLAFDHMREALKLAPENIQVIHTHASLLLQQSAVGTKLSVPIHTLLSELRVGLDNPHANHLLIADAGMRWWFKLLEENTNELIAEEQRNIRNQTPPDEAYIYGLTQGVFSKVCTEPFFQQALSQVVFSNPGLETILVPFRSAFTSLKVDSTFDKLSSFIHALSLQCYRNNYSWTATPDDQKRLETLTAAVNSKLESPDPESLVVDGILEPELYHHLSIISLFQPLYSLELLSPVLGKIDQSKTHKWFIDILKKTYWNYEEEKRILENLQELTPIPDESTISFYNKYIPVWDSAGLAAGRLTTVTIGQELEWTFRYYKPQNFDGTIKTLVVGCGSGIEVYQYTTFYKNIDITALDISANRIVYAIRQHKDLGVNNAKFYLGDITQLTTINSEQFDLVIANGVLHHLSEPMKGWERITALLRPGGIMKGSLYSSHFIKLLQKTRSYINSSNQFVPPLFSNDSPLPLLKRQPTIDEIRQSRNLILSCEEKDLEDLKELVTSPQFYALDEFAELVFHPNVLGFSFSVIGDCLNKLGLKLVGFEFPGITQEAYLKYSVEFPDDTEMTNIKSLEAFSKRHPDAFKNYTHTINFVAEKPL